VIDGVTVESVRHPIVAAEIFCEKLRRNFVVTSGVASSSRYGAIKFGEVMPIGVLRTVLVG
jgi:hypothetical protein